jgi:hypothetical protein
MYFLNGGRHIVRFARSQGNPCQAAARRPTHRLAACINARASATNMLFGAIHELRQQTELPGDTWTSSTKAARRRIQSTSTTNMFADRRRIAPWCVSTHGIRDVGGKALA